MKIELTESEDKGSLYCHPYISVNIFMLPITSGNMSNICKLTQKINKNLTEALKRQNLESMYISGYNLLGDAKYFEHKEVALMYARCLEHIVSPVETHHQMHH